MKRVLIVNADDCNLTDGVTQAILKCHQQGIVSSTTFLVNLPHNPTLIRRIKKQRRLGVGLHLNITLGCPVSALENIPSLIDKEGRFIKRSTRMRFTPSLREVRTEYENQIMLFRKIFGRIPTHLDTHHQLHDHPKIYEVLRQVAKKYNRPIRRSRVMKQGATSSFRTTDFWYGNLKPENYWRKRTLIKTIESLPVGVSEIMCHPGIVDDELKTISSFTTGRQREYDLLKMPSLRHILSEQAVRLSHFGLCYTKP